MSKLSVLLASYGPQSQRYLDLCFRSLEAQTYRDFEVVHVSSGEYVPLLASHDCNFPRVIDHSEERLHFPAAIAKAYELSNENSEYLLLLNDDTSLDTHCLERMVDVLDKCREEIIVNPLCNSDAFGFLYHAHTGTKEHFFQKPQYTFEEVDDCDLTDLFIYPFALIPVPFSPFYCTMMKRSTYDKVGGIDVKFQTNRDDLDFCVRARTHGIKSMVAMHAACFHFGGTTTNITKTPEEENFNIEYFNSKHGNIL